MVTLPPSLSARERDFLARQRALAARIDRAAPGSAHRRRFEIEMARLMRAELEAEIAARSAPPAERPRPEPWWDK